MREHAGVVGLLGAFRDEDAYRPHAQHGGATQAQTHAGVHGAGHGVVAIGQAFHHPGQAQRLPGQVQCGHVGLTAHMHGHLGTHTVFKQQGHRGRVAEGAGHHVFQPLGQHFLQHDHDVGGAASAAVVTVVHQDHRALLQRFSVCNRLGHRGGWEDKVCPPRPGQGTQLVQQFLAGVQAFTLGHHHHRQAGAGNVRQRKTPKHRGIEHLAVALGLHGTVHDVLHGLHRRGLAQHVRQHRQPPPQQHRRTALLQQGADAAAHAGAGFIHVHVGVGAVAGHHGGVADQLAAEVGVEVQGHADRQACRGVGAQTAQQLPLGVGIALDHHGAVQVQQDGVAALAGAVHHGIAQTFKGCACHQPAGHGVGADGKVHLGTHATGQVQVGSGGTVRALTCLAGSFAIGGSVGGGASAEIAQLGGDRGERIGLVANQGNNKFHGAPCLLFFQARLVHQCAVAPGFLQQEFLGLGGLQQHGVQAQ